MLQLGNFSAWISIDGKAATEYDVEISDDKKTATCWIASELGKRFSVHWVNSSYRGDTSGHVKMDGNSCGGKIIFGRTLPTTAVKDGVPDGPYAVKPFVFSSLSLTDDDAYLGGGPGTSNQLQDLGLIELSIIPVRVSASRQHAAANPARDLSALKVHERSKKAVTQQVTLGQSEGLARPLSFSHTTRAGPDLVTFRFKYRPLDILRANGIAPQGTQQLKRKASVEVSVDEDVKPSVKKEKKPRVGVKYESGGVIDLTEDDPPVRRKKVKLEGFSGQIIDLT
ncbi:hypothetical protein B0H16DRAFT_557321 [Mycena metata]|uniref:DUF7918 domain-containing protein n=1 Tax=Mycena metata TaxID=1033252 RepID=A0AAD7NHK2_9AGAR|nr:hypothetical protein B0H16DRAFT_557321 [Mycena metata]